jgi:hypothetical protein
MNAGGEVLDRQLQVMHPDLGTLRAAGVDEGDLPVEDVDVIDLEGRDLVQHLRQVDDLAGLRFILGLLGFLGFLGFLGLGLVAGVGRSGGGVKDPDLGLHQLDRGNDLVAFLSPFDRDLGPLRFQHVGSLAFGARSGRWIAYRRPRGRHRGRRRVMRTADVDTGADAKRERQRHAHAPRGVTKPPSGPRARAGPS